MFQFPGYRFLILCIHIRIVTFYSYQVPPFGYAWLLTDICSSSCLFAACHVLLRLLMPRHSPYALISLTYFLPKLIFQTFITILVICLLLIHYIFFNVLRILIIVFNWWAQQESNLWPHAYQACTLTIWAMGPIVSFVWVIWMCKKHTQK